ncbi:hypothetical protein AB0K18_21585 [Nonomuraea sp. NPDC049421]
MTPVIRLGLAVDNLLLGLPMAMCFAVALSYAFGEPAEDES